MKVLALALLSFSAISADVTLAQKGNVATVTITHDCSEIVAACKKEISEIETMRKNRIEKGEKATEVNVDCDSRIASAKRTAQVKMLDACSKPLQEAIAHASMSDADTDAEHARQKAKLDADHAKKKASRPAIDVDISK